MSAIRITRRRVTAVAATAALITLAAVGLTAGSGASADAGRTLQLTNAIDSIVSVGGQPPAQTTGGTFFVYSHVVSGGEGTTSASCVVVSTVGAGVRQCEVDMVLADGIITTRGLTDLANSEVTLVVTGGTGRYASARGTGTLTPTKTGSEVKLTLR
jgi:hypothetical protein